MSFVRLRFVVLLIGVSLLSSETAFADDDVAERLSAVEGQLVKLNENLSALIDHLSPQSASVAKRGSDQSADGPISSLPLDDGDSDDDSDDDADLRLADRIASLEKKVESLAAQPDDEVERLRGRVDVLELSVAELPQRAVSAMIAERPKELGETIRDTVQGRALIDNVSGVTRYVKINGQKWRVLPGRSVAHVSPSVPLQFEFDLNGGKVFTFYPREWEYRDGRYEMDLIMR
ncbi:MAG: hypothetical protein KDB27_35130 [Planctomycetales bacterium]|nr:hypothetical protein [Planctomycetales bacterium]